MPELDDYETDGTFGDDPPSDTPPTTRSAQSLAEDGVQRPVAVPEIVDLTPVSSEPVVDVEGTVSPEDFTQFLGSDPVSPPQRPSTAPPTVVSPPPTGVSLDAFFDTTGLQRQQPADTKVAAEDLIKPWMKFHRFHRVKTVAEVKNIVDAAIAHGRCALDLETQGFDNRIDYDDRGGCTTRHKIVGYCISVRGEGYYIPVRHTFDQVYGQKDPNVPNLGVEAEIRRLCQAAQPELTDEGKAEDPLGSVKIKTPGKLVIYFWNAKFDQEFLMPVTGIDFWHPASFEDGMLAAYTYYSDDDLGLKLHAERRLTIYDPDVLDDNKKATARPYEMIKFEDLFPKGMKRSEMKFADLYPEDNAPMVLYGCSDAICTELLCEAKRVNWHYTRDNLTAKYEDVVSLATDKRNIFTYKLEKQTAQAVRIMERPRAKIDKSAIEGLIQEAEVELAVYDTKIRKLASSKGFSDFNPGSTEQLSDFLFGRNGLDINPKPPRNPASDQYKTDAGTLEKLFEEHPDIEVLEWVVKFRQISKIVNTYLKNLANNCDEKDQLRFKFVQTGAATGRFTAPAGEPDHGYGGIPIQGIPGKVDPKRPKVAHSLRRMFVARPGYTLVKVDYAGQELRIVTNLSQEPVWLNEFKSAEARGEDADLHTLTAKAFFGDHITKDHKLERGMGKIANFSLIYGGGAGAIMRATKCDEVEAKRRKANFDKSVPKFAQFVKKQHEMVKRDLGVFTAFKRFIRIPDANISLGDSINGRPILDEKEVRRIRSGCERKATNFPIQGSGADILKISLVKLVKELYSLGWLKTGGDDSVRIIMTVHDELVFEVRHDRLAEAMPVISRIMESPSRMAHWEIHLVVEPLIGLNWEAKYDWNKILKGEKPVPEWLVGVFDPQAPVPDHTPKPIATGSPVPAHASPVKDDPVPGALPASPVAAPKPKLTGKIGQFVVTRTALTLQSIDTVRRAIVQATPIDADLEAEGVTVRLLNTEGKTLIDPSLGVRVLPSRFADTLKEYNLGGMYELVDN